MVTNQSPNALASSFPPGITYQHVIVDFLILSRQFFPGLLEPSHRAMTEARHDVEEGVEVLALLAVAWGMGEGNQLVTGKVLIARN